MTKDEYWFIFQNDRLLISKGDATQKLLTYTSASVLKNSFIREHLFAQYHEFNLYCAEIPVNSNLPPHVDLISLRKALESLGKSWYNFAAKAYAIINWDKNHHYCGRCGNETLHRNGTFERICSVCSLTFYPRISPSIIVLIQKNDEILMARGHHFVPGAYGLIAGFVEAGESVEEAVHREVAEEVGIKIKNLHYFGSQPWPFPDSLMMGFTAEYASGELMINPDEIEAAGWYRVDNLPGFPSSSVSIARKLIDYFIATQQKKQMYK